jgi:hypothetical protein
MTTTTTTDQTKYGAPDPNDPTDTVNVWGWCAPFCIDDGPTNGASVEDHGDHCESTGAGVEARDAQQGEVSIFTGAARPYFHGTVQRSLVYRSARSPKVELGILAAGVKGDDVFSETKRFYMTPGEARSLARHLSLFADVADGCTGDPNVAVAGRELELAEAASK